MTSIDLVESPTLPLPSSPARRAKLAVIGWLAEQHLPFEVGGRHLVRLLDLDATRAQLAPFVLSAPILSRSGLAELAMVVGKRNHGSALA